ncbi:DUF2007 domain-containing protein [Planctomycetes bacterium K23_9]|uniref:RanBP2-type domain-containing protein n=1 Tax=Stieleria marina TaxID=1930275 RepID=A0A517NZR5_9BACT|nr:hypothetical protein K239x_46130 [Planctomycetes bacterium K23_9]
MKATVAEAFQLRANNRGKKTIKMLTATKTLQVFSNPQAAEIIRTRLDAAGILSVINGAEVASMFGNMGPAFAAVRLEVAPEDFQRATEILEEDYRLRNELSNWCCVRCDENNDASFDLCWNCSKKREGLDSVSIAGSRDPNEQTEEPITAPSDAQGQHLSTTDNPYAPTWVDTRNGSPNAGDSDSMRKWHWNWSATAAMMLVAIILLSTLAIALLRFA